MYYFRKYQTATTETLQDKSAEGLAALSTIYFAFQINGQQMQFNGVQISDALAALDERLRRIEQSGIIERLAKIEVMK